MALTSPASMPLRRRSGGRIGCNPGRPEFALFAETKLLNMYSKCECLEDARKMFDGTRKRSLYTWSAMIEASLEKLEHGEGL
ncbi:uncharacterized protein J3R85_001235 [Psidium guajava]|nr:uncharacterized protein J3R85_001235 [Psidium guajava]